MLKISNNYFDIYKTVNIFYIYEKILKSVKKIKIDLKKLFSNVIFKDHVLTFKKISNILYNTEKKQIKKDHELLIKQYKYLGIDL